MRARGSWNGHPSASHRPYRQHRSRKADEVMRFTAILNTRTCPCNACIHQSMATCWCSLRRRADDSPRCARGCLRRARRRSFAVICASLHPITITHSVIDYGPQSPIPALYSTLRWLLTALVARVTLATMGFWWIDVESVSRKRTYVLVLVLVLPPPTHLLTTVCPLPAEPRNQKSLGGRKQGT